MRSRRGIFTLATLTALLTAGPAGAQTYVVRPTTVTIEEDWKIVVAHGDAAKDGPQMMTYMSPVGDSSSPYAWFMLNVRDNPNPYTPGGLMIQVWDYADTLITSNTSGLDTAKLNAANWGFAAPAPLQRNQFGATLGGPVRKDRTFVFGSYGGLRQLLSQSFNAAVVPTALERTGDFSQSRIAATRPWCPRRRWARTSTSSPPWAASAPAS